MADSCKAGKLFGELVEMAAHLRGPHGCPWDRKQTFRTILPHFLEEAHEVAEEVSLGDYDGFREEIGDTLFLAVLLVRFAEEEGKFDIADSIRSILDKMIRRHPHVYGNAEFKNESELKSAWERSKRLEKGKEERTSLLDGIPASLPALLRARRVQQKAASIGFDWKEAAPVIAKIEEELAEVTDALPSGDPERIEEEVGDLLFTVVNLARLLDVDPERALNGTVRKFQSRFRKIEERIDPADPPPLDVLDRYWNEAKLSDRPE